MKTLTNTGSLLASETIEGLCRAVVITRKDSVKVGFAESTAPTYDGVTFSENVLMETGSISLSANDNPSKVDVKIAMHADGPITLADVQDGIYDGATVEVLQYDAGSPSGADLFYWGDVGAISYSNLHVLNLQINGPLSRLRNFVTELYGPSCRAFFTDARCKIDAATVTETGTVASVAGRILTVSGVTTTDDYWKLGLLTMTSGDLEGRKREIRGNVDAAIELYSSFGREPEVGDTFTIRRGCSYDLSETTGCVFWNNIANFRGEPFLDEDAVHATIPQDQSDPYSSTVVFLAGFEGAIVDEAQGLTLSPEGNAAAGSGGKFGSGELQLDGTGDSVEVQLSTTWLISDKRFTIEAWVNFNSTGGDSCILSSWSPGIINFCSLRFGYYPSLGGLAFQFCDTLHNAHTVVGGWTPSTGTWYHVAVDRDVSGVMRVYADGVMLGTLNYPGFINGYTFPFRLGAEEGNVNGLNGKLDEVRLSKGIARYGSSAGYTVPTAAFPRPI